MENNPLLKYYRQPKNYLSLPSGGAFYPQGTVDGDPGALPVFGMTAMDEILMKTPDSLFSGESVVQVIRSCIPGLLNPWVMPSLDVDAALIAIRIATYGATIETSFTCKDCNESTTFDLDLAKSLDYLASLTYEPQVIVGPLVVNIKPLTYKEMTEYNVSQYSLRRQLVQSLDGMTNEEKDKFIDDKYKQLSSLVVDSFKKAIVSVEADDTVVEDEQAIQDWIKNSDKQFFDQIKLHLETLGKKWQLKEQTCECATCGIVNNVAIGLDQSSFFVSA